MKRSVEVFEGEWRVDGPRGVSFADHERAHGPRGLPRLSGIEEIGPFVALLCRVADGSEGKVEIKR